MDGKEEDHYCPTCGKPTTYRVNPEWLLGQWSGKFAGMLATLMEGRRKRRGVSMDELVAGAYENHPGDIPMYPVGSLRVLMSNNKDKLADLGWAIVGPQTTGSGFWLVPIEKD